MHNFISTDVGVFWAKMYKKTTFFYFVKVYTSDVIVLSKKLFKIDGWSIVF